MKVIMREHNDGLDEVVSAGAVVDCVSAGDDRCRQEFAVEADVNVIMRRLENGGMLPDRPCIYGEQDFEVDLMSAYMNYGEVARAWSLLDPEVKKRYGSVEALLQAANDRQLDLRVAAKSAVEAAAAAEVEKAKA